MNKIAIIGDSTCDLTPEIRKNRDIDYCRMRVSWTDKEKKEHEIYASLDWESISHKDYFDMLADGTRVFTSQVTEQEFDEVFERHLSKGEDIIYISCSSALSASIQLARRLVNDKYSKKYPNQKMLMVDSLCACVGQGLMLMDAADMRDAGKKIEDIAAYIEENKLRYHQLATVENLDTLKRAGRVKAGKAFFGNLFGLKPILISDALGNNFAIEKQKGRRNALLRLVELTKQEVVNPEEQTLWVSDAECKPEDIELLINKIKEEIPFKDVQVVPMGPIIGGTTGKGTIAVYFKGEKVTTIGE